MFTNATLILAILATSMVAFADDKEKCLKVQRYYRTQIDLKLSEITTITEELNILRKKRGQNYSRENKPRLPALEAKIRWWKHKLNVSKLGAVFLTQEDQDKEIRELESFGVYLNKIGIKPKDFVCVPGLPEASALCTRAIPKVIKELEKQRERIAQEDMARVDGTQSEQNKLLRDITSLEETLNLLTREKEDFIDRLAATDCDKIAPPVTQPPALKPTPRPTPKATAAPKKPAAE